MSKFLAGGLDSSPPSSPVEKALMFDYLTKTSIINLKEFTVNSIKCIVWESDLSMRTQKYCLPCFKEHKPVRET